MVTGVSGEAILRSIEEEATLEVERTIEAARKQAAGLVKAADEAAGARARAARAAAEPALRAEAVRIVNAARLRLLHRHAELAAAASEAAWLEARRRLDGITSEDGERWAAALDRLTAEALAIAGSDATVQVRAPDAPAVATRVAAGHGDLVALGDDDPPGPLVRSRDGRVEIDATLPSRLDRARGALAEEIAALLGIGE